MRQLYAEALAARQASEAAAAASAEAQRSPWPQPAFPIARDESAEAGAQRAASTPTAIEWWNGCYSRAQRALAEAQAADPRRGSLGQS